MKLSLFKQKHSIQYLCFILFILSKCTVLVAQNTMPKLDAPSMTIETVENVNPKDLSISQKVIEGETPDGIDDCGWACIQEQIKMGKYKAFANDNGGYSTANTRYGFHVSYHEDGTTQLKPYEQNGTDYHIGIRLTGVGYGELHTLDQPQALHAENIDLASGSKVTYQWSEQVTEWWINQEDRLEQWFYLKEAPQGKTAAENLRLRLALDTDMALRVQKDRLAFKKESHIISYDKFKAWDATGKALDVHFSQEGDYLDLVIADTDASYPLTIDPSFGQEAYVKASNTGANDYFGFAVAISGETVVVGAYLEDSNATGVNGDQANNLANQAGAAYVFIRTGGAWSQQAYLKASNTETFDLFGYAVAISGETIVVGAYLEGSNATGVDGDETNNAAPQSGAAYVFVRTGGLTGTWTQQAYLKASNTDSEDWFGSHVAISGETIVVGAWTEDSNATVVNGDEANNLGDDTGAAYVFVRTGGLTGTWTQQAYLKGSNLGDYDRFGFAVAISEETIVVGTRYLNAAYVFVRTGGLTGTWAEQTIFQTSLGDSFGHSVAISGETIVVGALSESSNATGVNGDETDNSLIGSGAAYVFVRTGGLTGTWTRQAYLKASNPDADDYFGGRVVIDGETIVVGSLERSNATGVDGDETDNSLQQAGAAYVFVRTGGLAGTWAQQAYLKASNTGPIDAFGGAIGISGKTIVVGANQEDSNATGINGNETNNSASDAGAVYIFGPPPIDLRVDVDQVTQSTVEGEFLTYVFTLSNEVDATATGVKARALYPSNTEFVAAIPSQGSYDANTKIWDVGTVDNATPQTLTITVKMK